MAASAWVWAEALVTAAVEAAAAAAAAAGGGAWARRERATLQVAPAAAEARTRRRGGTKLRADGGLCHGTRETVLPDWYFVASTQPPPFRIRIFSLLTNTK
jgi:cytochrome c5